MLQHASTRLFITTLAALAVQVAWAEQEQSPLPSPEQVAQSWRAREERLRTGKFTWRERCVTYPGMYNDRTLGPLPKNLMRTEKDGFSMALDGPKVSFRYFSKLTTTESISDRPSVSAFDGKVSAEMFPSEAQRYQGTINKKPAFFQHDVASTWPVLLTFRPLTEVPTFDFSPERVEVAEAAVEHNGRRCAVFNWIPRTNQPERCRMLVDASPPYNPVRVELYWKNNTGDEVRTTMLEMTHTPVDELLYVPASWRIEWRNGDGEPSRDADCTLTDYEINGAIPDSEFTLTPFPAGTVVVDEAQGLEYVQLEGGKTRPLDGRRPGARPVAPPANSGRLVWWLIAGNVLLLCLVAWMYFRRAKA